ncbi:MAG: (d)CMP kinase [Leptospiraceae bacterium]|nr:(d)CMP kinase [Leptospiraceae bacterium]
MNQNIVAIDGPAGSGKSTVAKEIAEKIGFHYLDTGSYYRAFTLYFHRIFKKENKNLKFSEWILSQDLKKDFSGILIQTEFLAGGMNKTILNSEDVSDEIRLPEVTEEIKYLAPIREVRDFVNQSLHELSKKYKLIMDGRDIGTEVFPDAKYKFYITASIDIRANRRYLEMQEKGVFVDLETLKEDIYRRDKSDMERKIAPLRQADDAILIDTTQLSKNVVINMILSKILQN